MRNSHQFVVAPREPQVTSFGNVALVLARTGFCGYVMPPRIYECHRQVEENTQISFRQGKAKQSSRTAMAAAASSTVSLFSLQSQPKTATERASRELSYLRHNKKQQQHQRQRRDVCLSLSPPTSTSSAAASTSSSASELEKPRIELEFVSPNPEADGSYGRQTAVADSGEKLLRNIMSENKIELYAAYGKVMNCGGGGSCGTCIVEIIDGQDLLNTRTDTENRYLKKKPASWRLACQTIVGNKQNAGKVVVQRLPQWKK